MVGKNGESAGIPADNGLGTEALGHLLLRLALPSILAQVVNLLYNLVDRVFVGRIPDTGALALAGVGVAFPVIMFISAFASLVGMGGAPRASMAMGRGDRETAERILAYRDTYGKFVTVEQLLDVEGIGEGLLEQLRPYVYVEESE